MGYKMKNSFWRLMFCVTLFSLIFTFIFGSDIPWENLQTACFSWPITKNILYDISVGVFSSMILVWCIDRIQSNIEEKDEKKRRQILYDKLSPLLKDYYNFFLYLYIATRNVPVEPTNPVLKSLYLNKDEFIKQLFDTNPFYKDGYIGDSPKMIQKINLMQQHSEDPEALKEIMKMSDSLPWYQCWNIDALKFYNGLSQVEKDYPTFFPNELLEEIDDLLDILQMHTNIVKVVEMRMLPKSMRKQEDIPILTTDIFVDTYKIVETLRLLDSIMEYIENDSSKKLRERNINFFNNRNVRPTLGHTCAKESDNPSQK